MYYIYTHTKTNYTQTLKEKNINIYFLKNCLGGSAMKQRGVRNHLDVLVLFL